MGGGVLGVDQRVGLPWGDPPAWEVLLLLVGHADAVDDGTDADAERAPRAVGGHPRQVGLGVKGDGLVARIVADHVALARS